MNVKLLDLYSDYLLSSFSATTATGLSRLLNDEISHDQVSRMLNSRRLESKDWWLMVKPQVRSIQREHGIISIDESRSLTRMKTRSSAGTMIMPKGVLSRASTS